MSSYGRACSHCTKAKVRCAFGNNRDQCERCIRLRKDCQAVTRKRVVESKFLIDKHAALEAKVDSLVELLKHNQATSDEDRSPSDASSRASALRSRPSANNVSYLPPSKSNHGLEGPDQTIPISATISSGTATSISNTDQHSFCGFANRFVNDKYQSSTTASASNVTGTSGLSRGTSSYTSPAASVAEIPIETEDELQDVLNTYRNSMFQFFPVVIVGPEDTVEYMAAERPMVWLVLRTICNKHIGRQITLSNEIRRQIATRLVMESERSFDTLAALVLYVNWGHFFCAKANVTRPIHLAIALAGDLGLLKPVPPGAPTVMLNWTQRGCPRSHQPVGVNPRTVDERRVILGLFLATSICANFFQRTEPMRWIPYFEECLQVLLDTKEHLSDEVVVILVRIQLIANGVQSEGWNEVYPVSGQKFPRAHHVYLHRMQLDELKRSIPAHLKDNPTIRFHIIGTEVNIHEQNLIPSPATSILDQTRRVEGLWACYSTVKSYFDYFFNMETFPLYTYLYISMGVYTNLGHCLVTLFRLSTYECPDKLWDRQRIVSELDVGDVVRRWVQLYDAAPEAAGIFIRGEESQDSPWEYSRKILLSSILTWWEKKIRPSIMNQEEQSSEQVSEQQQYGAHAFDATMPTINYSDLDLSFDNEAWMRDVLSSGFDFGNLSSF